MKHQPQAAIALTLAISLLFACSRSDYTISVADDEPEMASAISAARASLPHFWEVFDKRENGERDFALKLQIADSRGTEYFWVIDLDRSNGKLMGTIDNEPEIVESVKLGDRIEIPEADISDWFYFRDGKMVGNRTLRALFKEMSPEEVERSKAMLAEP